MSDSASTILVTGAAGFIGSHTAGALLGVGHRIVGIDNFDPFYDARRKRANIDALTADAGDRFALVEADICDGGAVRAAFERHRPEGVIHLAAKAGVRPSLLDPVGYARVNVVGTGIVLEEARRAGCRRIVVASSSSVYGNNRKVPFAESDAVDQPISPYAATKRAGEIACWTHAHLSGMPTACLRFFTVYGPRQRPDLAISTFMARIWRGEPVRMFGDGSTSRDYTYIDDIVAGVRSAYERIDGFGIWNLGSDRPVRLDALVAAIGAVVGREPVIERAPPQPGDVERTWADVALAGTDLGYRALTPLSEGLERQWEWMRSSGVLG